MSEPLFLGIDAGGTKVAWGRFTSDGKLLASGSKPTPQDKDAFLALLVSIVNEQKPVAVGIGIAGTVSADHDDVIVCPNIPALGHVELADYLRSACDVLVTIDNDARCALIGEVWLGGAAEYSSAVLLTVGTGIGGAVMQKGIVQPHPTDLNKELGHLLVDPTDLFPAPSGKGSLEGLIGGRNLEDRLDVDLAVIAKAVRDGDPKAKQTWKQISYYFLQSVRAVHAQFNCKAIIIGGKGSRDLEYYLQDEPPCPVIAAKLGEKAGLYGAARIAIDLHDDEQDEEWD